MWRAAGRAVAAVGIALASVATATAGPLATLDAPPALVPARTPEHATVRALRGLAALDRGYPLWRWARRASSVPSSAGGNENGGGLWLRIGRDADGDVPVPGNGRRLHAGSARVAAPFPFFPLAGGDDLFGQLWLRLGTRAGVRAEYHVVELGDAGNPLSGGLAPAALGAATSGRRALAHILGVGVVLALSDHVGVEAQYGHALGPALDDPAWAGAAHYGYVELSFRY